MRRSSSKVVRALTDVELVARELGRAGVVLTTESTNSVASLYRLVCRLEKRPVDANAAARPKHDAQLLFLRRWLEDRQARVATARAVPPFTEYQRPRAMQLALDRCPPRRPLVTITGSR